MILLVPQRPRPAAGGMAVAVAGPPEWLRLARLARLLSWLTLDWLGIEAGVAIGAAVAAGSVALLGFGLDSGIEAMASLIVIWRFTGPRLASATSERHAQQLVAVSFFLLAPYIAVEATRALAAGDRPETSITGLALTAGPAIFEPALGVVKRRIGTRLGSPATAGEGTQNLLCAYLAIVPLAVIPELVSGMGRCQPGADTAERGQPEQGARDQAGGDQPLPPAGAPDIAASAARSQSRGASLATSAR